MLLALTVVAITTTEQPAQPVIDLDWPAFADVEDLALDHAVGIDHVRTSLTFTVATDETRLHDVWIDIAIPRDAAVVGMRLALGEHASSAQLVWAEAARTTYERIVERERDPALLEWVGATDTHHQLRLRVFPVTAGTPATITLDLVAPRPVVTEFEIAPRVTTTPRPRPALGFGRQVGRKLALLATDRDTGTPAVTRLADRL